MSAGPIVFVGSICFIAYVLAGYPIALALYARLRSKPIARKLIPRELSIVIPVRNGAQWIETKIKSLLSSEYPADLISILVVSDGSSDNTNQLVEKFGDKRVRLLALPAGGKALAVNRGLEQATGEIVILTDVRQPFDPTALAHLVSCFSDSRVGVVTGELVIREGASREEFNTGLYWKYEKWIRRNLNRVDAMLGATGAIYAIRRELAGPLPPDTLLDDVHLPFLIASKGFRIYFEHAAKAYDLPTSLKSEFGRKVRTQAGVYQILFRFPSLLWPGNRRFIHFFSHKLGRLLLPFAMLTAAVATIYLPQPSRTIAIVAQCGFYGLALIDPFISEKTTLKRLTGLTRAFTVLVAAALCAVKLFFSPAQNLWKETRSPVAASRSADDVAR